MKIKNQGLILTFVLVAAALMLFVPLIVKWTQGPDLFISQETYYHVRMAEQVRTQGVLNYDSLQGTEYSFNLFHFVAGKSGIPIGLLAKILPLVTGVLSLLLAYFFFKDLELGENDTLFALIIFALTPIFIYSFTTFSPDNLAVPMLLLGAIFFLRKNYVSVLFFAPVFLIDILSAVVAFVMMMVYYFMDRKSLGLLIANFAAGCAVIISGVLILGVNPLIDFVPLKTGFSGLFVSFGALTGYSLIVIGLFFIGLFSWWDRHINKTIAVLGVVLMFAFSVFFSDARLFVSLIIAIPAGRAISYLANREWEMPLIKDVTIILIIYSVLFASILLLNTQVKMVDKDTIDAVKFLSTSDRGDVILSMPRSGFMIEGVAGRRAFMDDNSFRQKDYQEKIRVRNNIFYSRNLPELEALLVSNKITHILIDEDMKNGEVWNSREEGLLFFLQNSDRFINIFDNKNIQVYRYLRE